MPLTGRIAAADIAEGNAITGSSPVVVTNKIVGDSFDNYVLATKLRGVDEAGQLVRQEQLPTPEYAGLGKKYVVPDFTIYNSNYRVAAYVDAKSGASIPFDLQARGFIDWSKGTTSRTLIYYTPGGNTPISPTLLNYARQSGVLVKQIGVP